MAAAELLHQLDARRRKLGMSMSALAKRSGLSLPTVQRILSGRHGGAAFDAIISIASALGVKLDLSETKSVSELARDGAMEKARRLVRMVQGTSALEGQAVDADKINELTDQAMHALMAGPRRKLWTD